MKNNEKDILKDFAIKITERNLSVAAIFFLESTKYLTFIGGQALIFFGPILTIFINEKKYYDFIHLLEKKENVEFLLCKIETMEMQLNKQNS